MLSRAGETGPFAAAVTSSSASLAIIIPPSIPMIVYAFVVEESVLSMFLAGIGPGIVLALFFIIFSVFYVKFFNKEVQNVSSTLEEKIKYTKRGLPILLMAFIMLGGIYAGIYTPTEAGGIGFLISFIYFKFTSETLD